jgi:hypothetical protein
MLYGAELTYAVAKVIGVELQVVVPPASKVVVFTVAAFATGDNK